MHFLDGNTAREALVDEEQPLVGRLACGREDFLDGKARILRARGVSIEISAPRMAFISASSKVCAMAMTSPVAFIWVPSVRRP
jgi:hypothetical protein